MDDLALSDSSFMYVIYELSIFIAYFLKGFSGFGPALVFIPITACFYSPQTALVASAFIDIIVGICMLPTFEYSRNDIKKIARVSLFMGMGSIIGASMVGWLSDNVLIDLICIFVCIFGLNMIMLKQPLPNRLEPKEPAALWFFSMLGGWTGSLVGISGPLIVVGAKKNLNKSDFRKIMVAVFVVEGAIKLMAYHILVAWPEDVFYVSVAAAPMIILGIWTGYKLHGKISEQHFTRAIGLILVLISVNAYLVR